MTNLTRRIEALESGRPPNGGFGFMVIEVVTPDAAQGDFCFARVYGQDMVRTETESTDAFVERVKAAATSSMPKGHSMPTLTLSAHKL